MLKMNENEKAIIEAVERHNEYCGKVEDMFFNSKDSEIECIDTMRHGNIETGIEFCCKMRELKIDAVVDMVWGYVLPKSEADDSEIDGKPRYCVFEWYEEV